MPLAVVNGVVLYFAHVPKTGGSSIEAYLEAKGRVALLQKSTLGWSRCTAQHVERRIFEDLVPAAFADFGFVVVRDPLERLLSEYNYRNQLKAAAQATGKRRANVFRRALRRLSPSLINTVPASSRSFDDWAPLVFAAYARDAYVNDNHIRPQVEFVGPGHRIFRFEDGLGPVFDWIDAVTDTPALPRDVHLKRSQERTEVSERTRLRVREFYAADYAMLEGLPGTGG